ncbi:winged helix-turn-helix domain-containing protein [Methanobrevibacter sp. OttesenSCG-928-K11]|nr:winged helix-turn-helix domain-containing protein [Methanobrevibacter sp. OttesenSCG-928-K11]MDL2271298.1 winged helix-turn-helix domain-containing protein [Methanobrevibacter sp. OttesenSCG-928-I08]
MNKVLYSLISKKRGGPTRAKIINELYISPQNTNQLAKKLKIQYRTVNHHMAILLNENIVEKENKKYGGLYFLTDDMYDNKEKFRKFEKQMAKNHQK